VASTEAKATPVEAKISVTPAAELLGTVTWLNMSVSVSDADIKEAAEVDDKEVEISYAQRDVDKFGLFDMLLQQCS
jgi:hypothetical protein